MACLASTGAGKDALALSAVSKADLRSQAYEWLQAELIYLKKRHAEDKDSPLLRTASSWFQAPELRSVRDLEALKVLPEAESMRWKTFWKEVGLFFAVPTPKKV
jgi:hypothetical protein